MSRVNKKQQKDYLIKTVERKYGVDLKYKTDAELHKTLKEEGVPSLSRLLKLTQSV